MRSMFWYKILIDKLFSVTWIIYLCLYFYTVNKMNALSIFLQFSNIASFFPLYPHWVKEKHVENKYELGQ